MRFREVIEVPVEIKIANTPATRVEVHVDRPEWREFLYY
jgi:hypothetical protein